MPVLPTRVRPGDLITADHWNSLAARLDAAEARINNLELGTILADPVVITSIVPAGTLAVGQQIQVLGRGFADDASGNIVSVGGIGVDRFLPGTSHTSLVFAIPAVPGVPRSDVVLVVRNGARSDSRLISVEPAKVVPKGELVINDVTALVGAPGTITVGGEFTFWFDLDSQTRPVGETYLLGFRYSDISGASESAWMKATRLVNTTGAPLVPNPLPLEPGSPVRVGLRFTVPAGATRARVALTARSLNNDAELSRSSGLTLIEVGVTPEISDPRVTFRQPDLPPGARGNIVTVAGQTQLQVNYQDVVVVSIVAELGTGAPPSAQYTFSATLEPDSGPWNLGNVSPSTAFTLATIDPSEQLSFALQLNVDPAIGGAHPEARILLLVVQRADGDRFRSFLRIPITGAVIP